MAVSDPMHELLPWYVNGTLAPEEAEAFRQHLEGCEACRDELRFLQRAAAELERHGDALLEGHPDSERIVAAARGELEPGEAAVIERHLALCDGCAAETRWVRGEAVAAGAEAPPAAARRGWPLNGLGWMVAVAATIALLVTWQSGGPDSRTSGIVRPQLVTPTVRATGAATVLRLGADEPGVRLILEVDLASEAYPAELEVTAEAGRTVISRRRIAASDVVQGSYLFLDCSRRDCPPGRYRARLVPAGDEQPEIDYAFEVRPE